MFSERPRHASITVDIGRSSARATARPTFAFRPQSDGIVAPGKRAVGTPGAFAGPLLLERQPEHSRMIPRGGQVH